LALASGAELLPDEHGRTPLHLAAANDDKAMITLLLKRCKDPLRAKARGDIENNVSTDVGSTMNRNRDVGK